MARTRLVFTLSLDPCAERDTARILNFQVPTKDCLLAIYNASDVNFQN